MCFAFNLCFVPGTTPNGKVCTAHQDCMTASRCVRGTCRSLCENSTSCVGGDVCVSHETDDIPGATNPVEFCTPGCDFHAGLACNDNLWTDCLMGEMMETSVDYCFDVSSTSCIGMPVGFVCGPHSRCQNLSGGMTMTNTCVEYCAVSEGALGTPGHPDCTDATRTCTDVMLPSAGMCL